MVNTCHLIKHNNFRRILYLFRLAQASDRTYNDHNTPIELKTNWELFVVVNVQLSFFRLVRVTLN